MLFVQSFLNVSARAIVASVQSVPSGSLSAKSMARLEFPHFQIEARENID
jgi:hypothetical protein